MCYIETIHFTHCRHTNVAFRVCLGTEDLDAEHMQPNAIGHSMRRLCPSCLTHAVAFILIKTNGYNRDNYEEYVQSEVYEDDFAEYVNDALESNIRAREVVSTGLKSSYELSMDRDTWCPQNTHTIHNDQPGGIAHGACLVVRQDEFDHAVMCQEPERRLDRAVVTYSAAFRWDQRQTIEYSETENPNFRFGLEVPDLFEVLVYFSRCEHYNAIFMEATDRTSSQRSEHTKCGCNDFDWDLPFSQYAESSTDCMYCRRPAGHENDPRFRYAHRFMRMIPASAAGYRQIATWPDTARLSNLE
ncbi:hypothetical protein PV10_00603 [Exophiala mesophila]|uniref:Uncharacterized protein n=1 Tax=Exophiala mesophila TaxID=212818 RepID=A0A0D1X4R6_EXOME|nr:uncharacterized protein PV10_00603 [Exophiala mesophila]KIV96785.1 hypothetical protein PV10_00603 [Exophiala mesophila]